MAHEYYFAVDTDDDRGVPFGPVNKDNMDVSRLIVDMTCWLDSNESVTHVEHMLIAANPSPTPTNTWRSDYPLNGASYTGSYTSDTHPLDFERTAVIHGGKAVEVDVGGGTPGLSYAVSFTATAGVSRRRRVIDVLVTIDQPVNPAMIGLAETPPSYFYPLIIYTGTILPYGFAGRVHIENSAGSAIQVTLPPSPLLGQKITFADTGLNNDIYPVNFVGDASSPSVSAPGTTSYGVQQKGFDLAFVWTGSYWHVDDIVCLPVAGGAVHGDVGFEGPNGINISGIQIKNASGYLAVSYAGGGGITSSGPGAGFVFNDRDQVSPGWQLVASSGTAYLQVVAGVTAIAISSVGEVSVLNAVVTPVYYLTHPFGVGGVKFAEAGVDTHTIFAPGNAAALTVYGSGGTTNYLNNQHSFINKAQTSTFAIFNASGCFNVGGASWQAISDDHVKENVEPYMAGLEAVLQLNPVSFNYVVSEPPPEDELAPASASLSTMLRSVTGVQYGLMASEVAPVLPEMVGQAEFEGTGTVSTLSPTHLVYVLLNAVKELEARIRQLETPAGE